MSTTFYIYEQQPDLILVTTKLSPIGVKLVRTLTAATVMDAVEQHLQDSNQIHQDIDCSGPGALVSLRGKTEEEEAHLKENRQLGRFSTAFWKTN